jgi:DNA modification methylase
MIIHGNCIDVLKTLQKPIDCCVTSPPYWNQRDYGTIEQFGNEKTVDDYIFNLLEVFKLVQNVMADHGTLFLNIGDVYYKKELACIPFKLAMSMQSIGWKFRQTIIWNKPSCKPESVKDRFTNSFEYVLFFTKSLKYYFDWEANSEIVDPSTWGLKKDMTYAGKDQKVYDGTGAERPGGIKERMAAKVRAGGVLRKNKRNVWNISKACFKGEHVATFPEELSRICVKAGCRPGGTVLDPFSGAATTGVSCKETGREYIGIEINADFCELSKKRLEE